MSGRLTRGLIIIFLAVLGVAFIGYTLLLGALFIIPFLAVAGMGMAIWLWVTHRAEKVPETPDEESAEVGFTYVPANYTRTLPSNYLSGSPDHDRNPHQNG
jgi:hypothetical protein